MFKGSRHNGGIRWRKQRSWDLFSYLAPFLASELKAFKKYNVNGVPQYFFEQGNNSTDEGAKLWHEAIDKMIWSFEEIANEHPSAPHNIAWKEYWEKFGKYHKAEEWTYEKDGVTYWKSDDRYESPPEESMIAYNEKVKEGLYLFAEHFEDLWD